MTSVYSSLFCFFTRRHEDAKFFVQPAVALVYRSCFTIKAVLKAADLLK